MHLDCVDRQPRHLRSAVHSSASKRMRVALQSVSKHRRCWSRLPLRRCRFLLSPPALYCKGHRFVSLFRSTAIDSFHRRGITRVVIRAFADAGLLGPCVQCPFDVLEDEIDDRSWASSMSRLFGGATTTFAIHGWGHVLSLGAWHSLERLGVLRRGVAWRGVHGKAWRGLAAKGHSFPFHTGA